MADVLRFEMQGATSLAVSEDGRPITVLSRLFNSPFELDGEPFEIARQGTDRFTLTGRLGTIAVGDRAGDTIAVACPPHTFGIVRGRRWSMWTVYQDGQPVGTCRAGLFRSTAEMSAELPRVTKVFLFYIAFMLTRGGSVGIGAAWA